MQSWAFNENSVTRIEENKDEKNRLPNQRLVVQKLLLMVILCSFFMLIEIFGGIVTNSLAISCDALHLLSDLIGYIITLFTSSFSSNKPTKCLNFGFQRLEVLGAFLSILIIWVLTSVLCYFAIRRMINLDDFKLDVGPMIVIAGSAVIANIIMMCVLSYEKNSTNELPIDNKADINKKSYVLKKNINIRAAFIHIVGDMTQSIGVLISCIIIYFRPNLNIIDPICTLIFSTIVLATTFTIIRDIFAVFMEAFPRNLDYNELRKINRLLNGVVQVTKLKVWYLGTESYAINVCLTIDPLLEFNFHTVAKIRAECENLLKNIADFHHLNIEIKYENES